MLIFIIFSRNVENGVSKKTAQNRQQQQPQQQQQQFGNETPISNHVLENCTQSAHIQSQKKQKQLGVNATMQEISNSCRCKNSNCQMQGYKSMKQVVAHINTCQKGVRGGCPTCNYHVALCCHHSKLCQKDDCPLSFCKNLKLKLKHHQQFKNVFHESLLRYVFIFFFFLIYALK